MPANKGSVQCAVSRRSSQCCTTWGSQHMKGWKISSATLFSILLLSPAVAKHVKTATVPLWVSSIWVLPKLRCLDTCRIYRSPQHSPLQNTPSLGIHSFHFTISSLEFSWSSHSCFLYWQLKGNYWSRASPSFHSAMAWMLILPLYLEGEDKFWKAFAFEVFKIFWKLEW